MVPTKSITDIPSEEEADEIVESFESDGCTAKKERQPNGNYTVNADCPAGSTSDSGGNAGG